MGRKREREDEPLDWLPPFPAPRTSSSGLAGSSHYPILVDTPPKTSSQAPPVKRQRKKKDPDAPVPEKRGAIFKKAAPKAISERVDRVASQRFFMVDRKRNGNELREEFSVLGSTGNIYTVVIDKKPSCNCPDALKGNHCKHILFIYMKVLQVPYDSPHWYQKALLTSELETIFAEAPLAPNSLAHQRVRDAYAQATGKKPADGGSNNNDKRRLPGPDDNCPICYEEMEAGKATGLTFCETRGNGLHLQCFQQWARSAPKLNCVFCRAEWIVPGRAGPSSSRAGRSSEGYINLAGAAGVSPQRYQ